MRVPLEQLSPEWIEIEGEWGCGVSFRCPVHDDHRIRVEFEQCCSGNTPTPNVLAYHRTGTSFATLSLHPVVELPGCGRMLLHSGEWFILEH
jgi:hypothetical protein